MHHCKIKNRKKKRERSSPLHFFYRHSDSSFKTQKCNAFVVDIFDNAETTCTYYVKMVENLRKNPDSAFKLPTLKSIFIKIEEKNSKDGKPVYQNQVAESNNQQKQFLRNNAALIIKSMVADCFTTCCKCIELKSNDESTNGDSILFNVCCILNTKHGQI